MESAAERGGAEPKHWLRDYMILIIANPASHIYMIEAELPEGIEKVLEVIRPDDL